MENWKAFCDSFITEDCGLESLKRLAKDNPGKYYIYPDSIHTAGGFYFFIARDIEIAGNTGRKVLIIYGKNSLFNDKNRLFNDKNSASANISDNIYDEFDGYEVVLAGGRVKVCKLNSANCDIIRRLFQFTNPSNHRGVKITMGLGDRLGPASPGHIRLLKGRAVFPVLAQQSIRELNLTGRTYRDVLSAASWAVFQEGYASGFGADGDHLKTPEEVKMAIDSGFTMITLDCSEHIDNAAASLPFAEMESRYLQLPLDERVIMESKYLGKEFVLEDGSGIAFDSAEFRKIVLVYFKAVKFAIDIYNNVIKPCGRKMDFEMSVDETLTSTTPEAHFFAASELMAGGVEITSLAPRFCGEFQKGIDYRGDIARFTKEFEIHVKIARHFGYKISVHSGSDKFGVFPIIGEKTQCEYHLKTAGTNWLEAVRTIASKNPYLYRRMHKFAVNNLSEAKKYYHISANPAKVPDVDNLKDSELPGLMDMDDSRQVLHITYGLILLAKNPDGIPVFRDDIYSTLDKFEEEYYEALERHIGKHLWELRVESVELRVE